MRKVQAPEGTTDKLTRIAEAPEPGEPSWLLDGVTKTAHTEGDATNFDYLLQLITEP